MICGHLLWSQGTLVGTLFMLSRLWWNNSEPFLALSIEEAGLVVLQLVTIISKR